MEHMYYIGLDVHKRKISYCVKDGGGKVHAEGSFPATRLALDCWMKTLPQPWSAAMEATSAPAPHEFAASSKINNISCANRLRNEGGCKLMSST